MLNDLKTRVLAVAQTAEADGLCRHRSGNMSARDPETGYVVITPSGLKRADLEPDDLIVVDAEGNVVENVKYRKPSIETGMHLAIYRSRPDAYGIVHTHSHYATSYAAAGVPIRPVIDEAEFYDYDTVMLAEYGKPGSPELAENAAAALKNHSACLLARHGLVAIGDNCEEALKIAAYVEDVASVALDSAVIKFLIENRNK